MRPREAQGQVTTAMIRSTRAPLGHLTYVAVMGLIALYFVFAAVQGNYGIFRRAEVDARTLELRLELASLSEEVTRMENLTRRLSDDFLDLDLLDQQARDVLGLIRADEVVIR
jgi:cell division protein FtsB